MGVALGIIKADIGSIGGHIAPPRQLLDTVRATVREKGEGLLVDSAVTDTGDDSAILMAQERGVGNTEIHRLAWDAFLAGTEGDRVIELVAPEQLYEIAASLPMSELEYTGIMEAIQTLDQRFRMRQ